jgi:hypothetical protein
VVAEPIWPYIRPHRLAKIDGRTKIAKLMRETRATLTAHVGGEPSATQRALIERVVWLTLKCSLTDAKIAAGTDTDYDSKSYLAWSNALRRALRDLVCSQPRQSSRPLPTCSVEVTRHDPRASRGAEPLAHRSRSLYRGGVD